MFRGILSILLNPPPDESRFIKGLLVLSCSEEHAKKILAFARERYPGMEWTILYRYDAGGVFKGERVVFSSDAVSVTKKISLLMDIRSKKYDVVYVAWTNEPSYGFLKIFALFSGFGYLRVFNEHLGAFYFIRENYSNLKRHILWRWQTGSDISFNLANVFSWVVLMPMGLLYTVFQAIRYGVKGMMHSRPKH